MVGYLDSSYILILNKAIHVPLFQTRCIIDICSTLKQGTRVLAILTFLAQGPGMLSAGIMAVQNDP
jgi:hypothetical protein